MGTPTVVGVSNAAGQSNGASASNSAPVTPTLPSGAANGDRIFIHTAAFGPFGTVPTNWNLLYQNQVVTNRNLSCIWRDYDGVWSMPTVSLTPNTNRCMWAAAVALRRSTPLATWDTPTNSGPAADNTSGTGYSVSIPTFQTHAGGLLMVATGITLGSVTSTGGSLSQTGGAFGTVAEQADGGTTLGSDVAGKLHTVPVTTGANAGLTWAMTLSAASVGDSIIVEQTETAPPAANTGAFFAMF